MSKPAKLKFDEIGYWSEIKLDIVKDYAAEYSKILSAQKNPPLTHVYVDAFAGAGQHISKSTGKFIPGSPANALNITPPFKEYHFIDLNKAKVGELKKMVSARKDVFVYEADCNQILLDSILPRVRYEDYRRGLCLLDPYGLHLNWNVIRQMGQMGTFDMFLNFPVADMNRNVFWRNPDGVDEADVKRMDLFWGDESWKQVAYSTDRNLFGFMEKTENTVIAEAFRERLKNIAGFKYVPEPLPMKNTNNAIIYYLFFAAQKPVTKKIVDHIFKKYRTKGGV